MNHLSFPLAITSLLLLASDSLPAETLWPFTYTDEGSSITIDRYADEGQGLAVVPETINGKPVTVIGEYAFSRIRDLQEIVLPKGIIRIEEEAFYGCGELIRINIPAGVSSIGEGAFYQAGQLATLRLPPALTQLGSRAFQGCNSIQVVRIPPGITEIGVSTFEGCSSLSHLTIPATVRRIDDYAFAGCSHLEYATFQGNAPSVGVGVFDDVSNFFAFYSNYDSKGFTYPTWLGLDSERIPTAILDVLNPKGFALKDGLSTQDFGSAKVGKEGKTKTYTIDNSGNRKLTDISIRKSGANKGDFKVSVLPKNSLKAYGTMEFTVTFNPKGKGTRNAILHLQSSNAKNPSFEIKLTGKSLAR